MIDSKRLSAVLGAAVLVAVTALGLSGWQARPVPAADPARPKVGAPPAPTNLTTTLGQASDTASVTTLYEGTLSVVLSGTWSGTISFTYQDGNGWQPLTLTSSTDNSAVTSTTANGTFTAPLPANVGIKVQFSTYTSGTANVVISTSPLRVGLPASKRDLTILASAARTAQTDSADFVSDHARGVVLFLNVTAASGTGGLTVNIQMKDPVTGNYSSYYAAAAAVTSTGQRTYHIYPGASGGGTESKGGLLPHTWRVRVTVGDSSSYSYSIGACTIP